MGHLQGIIGCLDSKEIILSELKKFRSEFDVGLKKIIQNSILNSSFDALSKSTGGKKKLNLLNVNQLSVKQHKKFGNGTKYF